MPIPGVIAEDAVCLGDHVPSFDIGEGGIVSTPRADVFRIEFGLKALQLCFAKRHHFVLTARLGVGLPSCAQGFPCRALGRRVAPADRVSVAAAPNNSLGSQALGHDSERREPARADRCEVGLLKLLKPDLTHGFQRQLPLFCTPFLKRVRRCRISSSRVRKPALQRFIQ